MHRECSFLIPFGCFFVEMKLKRQSKTNKTKRRISKCNYTTFHDNFPFWCQNLYGMWTYSIAQLTKSQIASINRAPPGHMCVSIYALLVWCALLDFLELNEAFTNQWTCPTWDFLALTEPDLCETLCGWKCPEITVRQVKKSPWPRHWT